MTEEANMKQLGHVSVVETVTPKEFLKIRNNTWDAWRNKKPRMITVHGFRLRVLKHQVLGVFYHRGPKLLVYLFGQSSKTGKAT